MAANVCGREKTARWIFGIILFVAGIIVAGTAGWIMGIGGVILILTAMFSYCPVNAMFHRNTCMVRSPGNRDINDL
ncbi:hypothetical protein MYP_2514 [Sporocytophaga myxococcoides]|uniref:Inner membrane protein YgaP-like transmembrane domain-containing protein n=2 Tax=Sporocytophaga myxococcoides TaxID=153721 RepID=A0A098LEE5_9BACT|nr:hypothetical protein MYP_2514 [Sporocytophaga myxococcoides]